VNDRANGLRRRLVVVYAALSVLVGGAGANLYLLFWPPHGFREVYTYPGVHDGSATDRAAIRPVQSVYPGGSFFTYREVCYDRAHEPPLVLSALVEDNDSRMVSAYRYPVRAGIPLGVGCHNLSVLLEVPPGLSPGRYWLETRLALRVNTFRTETVALSRVPVIVRE